MSGITVESDEALMTFSVFLLCLFVFLSLYFYTLATLLLS